MQMTEKLWEQFDLSQIEEMVEKLLEVPGGSFQDLVGSLISGDFSQAIAYVKMATLNCILPGFLQCKKLLLSLLFVVLATVFVHYLTMLCKSRQVTQMAYDILFLLIMLILLHAFGELYVMGEESIGQVKEFITVLIPAYSLSIAMSQGAISAMTNYQLLLILLVGIDYIMLRLFLPLTKSCFLVALMNGLDERDRLRELWNLLMKIISWGMKICFSLTIAVSGLSNLVTENSSGMQKTLVRKVIGVIPGIGDLGDSVTGVFLTCVAMIRNGIGAAAIIVLLLIILRPILMTFGVCFSIRLTSVCSSVLGQKRMARSLSDASECSMQLLKMHLCTVMLFCIVLAVTMNLRV